jgi:esterase/lipase superfamily enzyme
MPLASREVRMILISCRRDFSDPRRFADQNVIRNYPLLPKLDQFTELGEDNLAGQMQGKHVLILVHGYRNSLDDVGGAYQKLLKGLVDNGLTTERGYELVLGFAWPGFATVAGFFPAVPFANRSAGFFRSLLELASRSARTVDVQTHSLGARVVLQALAAGTIGFVDNLMLTSPAVDDEVLEPGQEFNGALNGCRRCIVYHTQRDNTLRFAFRIGDAPEFDRALGWKGPQHPDIIRTQCPEVFVVDCKRVVASHGGYRAAPAYFAHWVRVVRDEPLPQFDAL